MKFIFLLLFYSTFTFSQTHSFTGIVTDEDNNPLESANVIAKPLQKNANIKFAIVDNNGRYKLELETNIAYEITVSYISYKDEMLNIDANSKISSYNFKLISTGEQLNEIIIKYDFKPIVIKKDTLTYNVKAFSNGNERKMREVLEKLPGVEVDKNGVVTVQGKKVTKMLVEGRSFFGGGSKLAVENIPADALDKIEVIDHFNEVGFMKQVSESEDLAMNVKLKEDKKKFIFGDIEAGVEISDSIGYYLGHAGLFYYTPKSNLCFIGDINNIGKSTFTFDDFMRFEGGTSSYLNGRKSLSNLYSFTNSNIDIVRNQSQFGALNFSFNSSSKFSIIGFGIFSKVIMESKTESKNEYLQNSSINFENKLQNNISNTLLSLSNIKFDYSPNKEEKYFYNTQFQSNSNDINNVINSITNLNSNIFRTISTADNISFKQYLEWHKKYNEHRLATFVINQTLEKNTPQNSWSTTNEFLSGLIPLQNDTIYNINQIKRIDNNSVDVLFKYYWIINNTNQLYTNIGNNYITSQFQTSEKQLLSNGAVNDFSNAGFGNNIKYKFNDSYFGLEYKFKIGKWSTKPGLYLHWYQLNTTQDISTQSISKTLFQPQLNSEYEFNKSESLSFVYRLSNTFPEINQVANRFTLQSYNSVFQGNALLKNECYHSANMYYYKLNMYKGINLNTNLSFNKKIKTIRNVIDFNGINQYATPILTNNPETNLLFNGFISKKIYRFNLKLNCSLSWFEYLQSINSVTTKNNRNNQNIGLTFQTSNKKLPDFSITYTKGFGQFIGSTKSNFVSDRLSSDFGITLFKYWIFKAEYQSLKNTNSNNQTNFFQTANTSLRFQKKNSPLGIELSINNLFDIKEKNDYAITDFVISETRTYVMPRFFLFSISYKI